MYLLCLTFPIALPENCEYVVNFAPELSEIIAEAKYLEKLGFQVPDLARSVALQESQFIGFQDGLNRCLYRYHRVLASLSDAEVGPVAGAISWSRSLFQRIKQTVLRFQTMKELIDSEAGKTVSDGKARACIYICEGFTTMVANEGLGKASAYLNQVSQD